MNYSGGRMAIYVDMTTAKDEYTNATFDSMTDPFVDQMCDIFGMHIITDLTQQTTRGKRYFIGYDDDDPKFAIGWAVGNTYVNAYYLICVGMLFGEPLSNILDAVSSSSISNSNYYIIAVERNWTNGNTYFFVNYIKDDNCKGISRGYSLSSISQTNNYVIYACIFKIGTQKLLTWSYNSQYGTLDYTKDGLMTYICKSSVYFVTAKNYIGNSDMDYLIPFKIDHGVTVLGLYLYSRQLTAQKIYAINDEYYYCIMSSSSDGSYLIKINYVP